MLMEPVLYTVMKINGEYAVMQTDAGILNTVAMALLPIEISEGDNVIYEMLEYRIVK